MLNKVSVIMPVYGGERYLSNAIDSVLSQTHHNLELIIVNDNSPDRSDEIVRQYFYDPRVIYLRNTKNQGVAASRNNALRQATGSYITFLDQDDIWLPNKLKIQIAAFGKHPELGLIHSDLALIDQNGVLLPQYQCRNESHFDNPRASIQIGFVFNQIFISNDIQPLTSMIPRGIFEEVGQFNEDLPGVDDYELWLRIARFYPIGQIQTILGYWRKHETQQSTQGYKMLILRLKAIDSVFRADPGAVALINRQDYVRRMHALNCGVANHYLYNIGDYRQAIPHFFRAIKLKPLDINTLFKLAYCCLPEGIRKPLRWVKNKRNIGFH